MNQTRLIGPHGHDFENVANCLTSFRDETVVFVPNPGNAGDNLINLGAYRLFENLGMRYVLGMHSKLYPDRVIIHSGGGSMVGSIRNSVYEAQPMHV